MHLGKYVALLYKSEQDLAKAFKQVAKEHGDEPDVLQTCQLLSGWSGNLSEKIKPYTKKYAEENHKEPDRLTRVMFDKKREGATALLMDLQDLYVLASEVSVCCVILNQAAAALRDEPLMKLCKETQQYTDRQQSWLLTRMKQTAPQSLIAAE